MTWIFESCPDQYGSCIRQYTLLGLSLMALLLAAYSCFKIYSQQSKLTFELLPISINVLTSLVLVCIYTQMEIFNIRVSLLIIELYSYFVLTYGFIYMIFRRNNALSARIRKIRIAFTVFTAVCVVSLIGIIIASLVDIVTCDEDQGIGSVVLICLQVPLLVATFAYSQKTKTILQSNTNEYSRGSESDHLLGDDGFKKIKLLQLRCIRLVFVITFVLHISEVIVYYSGNLDAELTCTSSNQQIKVTSPLILTILLIENVTQLIPHFIIPIIFWYLPSKLAKQAVTLYLSREDADNIGQQKANGIKIKRQESRLVNDVQYEEAIRKKLHQNIPKRLQRTSTI